MKQWETLQRKTEEQHNTKAKKGGRAGIEYGVGSRHRLSIANKHNAEMEDSQRQGSEGLAIQEIIIDFVLSIYLASVLIDATEYRNHHENCELLSTTTEMSPFFSFFLLSAERHVA